MNLDQIKARFQSGNSVPVDKAMLPKAEFDYLIDRIEQLEASLKRANKQFEHFEREWYFRGDRIEQLERENAELRKDAERYRFIRRPALSTGEFARILTAIDTFCEWELDAAIDEAMKS
jgi:hypothetical protein